MEKRAFRSAFNFLIERLDAPDSPDFWDETARKILEVADADDALGMDLLCAAFAHLERVRGGECDQTCQSKGTGADCAGGLSEPARGVDRVRSA